MKAFYRVSILPLALGAMVAHAQRPAPLPPTAPVPPTAPKFFSEAWPSGSERPEGDLAPSLRNRNFVSAADYPAAALRAGEQGTVVVLLKIDAEGEATSCEVKSSSGSAILDKSSCALALGRARYHPAKDASGRRIASTTAHRLTWALPKKPVDLLQGLWRLTIQFDAAGKPQACKNQLTQGAKIVEQPCDPPAGLEASGQALKGRRLVIEEAVGAGDSDAYRLPPLVGELRWSTAVRLSLKSDGVMTQCTVVRRHGTAAPSDPCRQYANAIITLSNGEVAAATMLLVEARRSIGD